MYLYGASEIVASDFRPKLPARTIYINATVDVLLTCRVATSDSVCDAGVHLYVIRISPVRDLSLSIDDVPYVTWTIPSVIAPDIPVSGIRYTVTLEGDNITSTVNDIDDTYYQFTDITVLNCTVHTATVTAYDVKRSKNDLYRSNNVSVAIYNGGMLKYVQVWLMLKYCILGNW